MKITIKKRDPDEILLEGEAKSLKEFCEKNKASLRGADFQGVDLQGVDFRGAYLWKADLRGADLRGAYLRGADFRAAEVEEIKIKNSQKDELLKALSVNIQS